MSENAIVAEGLRKRFSSAVALDGIDLEVPLGGLFGLLGQRRGEDDDSARAWQPCFARAGGRCNGAASQSLRRS